MKDKEEDADILVRTVHRVRRLRDAETKYRKDAKGDNESKCGTIYAVPGSDEKQWAIVHSALPEPAEASGRFQLPAVVGEGLLRR